MSLACPTSSAAGSTTSSSPTAALTLDGRSTSPMSAGSARASIGSSAMAARSPTTGWTLAALPERFRTIGGSAFPPRPPARSICIVSGGFDLQFWDGPNSFGNGRSMAARRSGTPSRPTGRLTDGNVNARWQRGFAVFQGTPGHGHAGRRHLVRGDAVPHRRLCDPGRRLLPVRAGWTRSSPSMPGSRRRSARGSPTGRAAVRR